jgi:hypothetical protein
VGYASSRAHDNNDTNTNINTNYNNKYNSNSAGAVGMRVRVEALGIWLKVLRAHDNNTSRSGFHNSHGVFKSFAQAARIAGGLCQFARTQQQHRH